MLSRASNRNRNSNQRTRRMQFEPLDARNLMAADLGLGAIDVTPDVALPDVPVLSAPPKLPGPVDILPDIWCREVTLPGPRLVGDIDDDGVVDSSDLGLLLNEFGTEGKSDGDLNGDSNVDSGDLGLLLNNFGNKEEPGRTVIICDELFVPLPLPTPIPPLPIPPLPEPPAPLPPGPFPPIDVLPPGPLPPGPMPVEATGDIGYEGGPRSEADSMLGSDEHEIEYEVAAGA